MNGEGCAAGGSIPPPVSPGTIRYKFGGPSGPPRYPIPKMVPIGSTTAAPRDTSAKTANPSKPATAAPSTTTPRTTVPATAPSTTAPATAARAMSPRASQHAGAIKIVGSSRGPEPHASGTASATQGKAKSATEGSALVRAAPVAANLPAAYVHISVSIFDY